MCMRGLYLIAVLVAALVTLACSGAANECEPTGPADLATQEGWRGNIDRLVASAPPDSIVKAGVLYYSAVTDDDRALLSELGAHISYEFKNVPALTIHIRVAGLPILAESAHVKHIGVPSQDDIPYDC